jgi:farnesyl diphosphate synthase
VARVKAVYGELGMKARFEDYEAASYARLSKLIEEQTLLPAGVFTNLLAKIYKRKK